MFDWDKWQEIFGTMQKNKLRTFLTACGVFWGILMLLMLLGFGKGLENGIRDKMSRRATNSVYIWGQRTAMPYKGMAPGRSIDYRNDDIEAIRWALPGVEHLAPRNQLGGWREGNNIARGAKTGNFAVMGDYPALKYIQPMLFEKGRFINELDMRDRRKVAVIGSEIYHVLFEPGEDPIGQSIRIRGVYFQVVGLFRAVEKGRRGDRQATTIFVQFTTFQHTFNRGDRVGWFAATAVPNLSASVLEQNLRSLLAQRHRIDPKDEQAIGSYNAEREFGKIQKLFAGLRYFLWLVGIATLLAGVVGVSNIMLITVKERTREIGVRKALGATPGSIIALVIQEAIVLTSLAGYLGVIIGVFALEMVGKYVKADDLSDPQVDLQVALVATLVLVVSGALAGIIPARHAAAVNPVEALR